jgi:hypothetical protein
MGEIRLEEITPGHHRHSPVYPGISDARERNIRHVINQ